MILRRRLLAAIAAFAVCSQPVLAKECRDLPVLENVQSALFSYVAKNGTSASSTTVQQ